jgi:MurNAc alpha-1-phosphate uridylyltransferase
MRLNTLESNSVPSASNEWVGTSDQSRATALDKSPKPLLTVHGKPLMQWHMEALAKAGHHDQLINTAWLGDQIESQFGLNPDLPQVGHIRLRYSHEGKDFGYALETAGGIVRALPALAPIFWVVAGDIYAPEFEFSPEKMASFEQSSHLVGAQSSA